MSNGINPQLHARSARASTVEVAQAAEATATRPVGSALPGLPSPSPATTATAATAATHSGRRGLLLGLAGLAATTCAWGLDLEAWAAEGITTVFVAGSTGNTGRRVVQQLRQAGFKVRAGARSPAKALSLGFGADAGIEVVEADVTKGVDELVAAIGGAQAVVCATGAVGFGANGAGAVDEKGTQKLVDAALRAGGVTKFVLVSSLLTNAAAVGQSNNPNYRFLNLFGGVLDAKLKAEKYLRGSGLNYTIIRPGGLSNEPEPEVGNLILRREDSLFGLDSDPGRAISRDTVAAVAVQALLQPAASRDKLVEVVASPSAPRLSPDTWFDNV
ncbi:hypothetical protein HYH02_008039 [Chlamydomonas schloesseri]|uniref:NAD(P)-binding domain-containing protein n=1 Tax=Chlamydomonas schloesseri TaxID=2026947 RepID=A0A835WGG5_9CHLO|nr:hypothetical protein HYH02_008039 [Chlamydomonas schloesseri]|eukprot:KAG2446883.1 hypothetical protein HYH02_008039 [Chlamydomonas schloesseri]